MTRITRQEGFSLLEAVVAIGVLCAGVLGMAGVFTFGMQKTASSPSQTIMAAKAVEAVESVFSARDSHTITWAQLQNVSNGGIFKDGPTPLKTDGPDGVLNTADDGPVETVTLPGPDQKYGTADDKTETLSNYTREIRITTLSSDLRSITVTITSTTAGQTSAYTLTAYISTFA